MGRPVEDARERGRVDRRRIVASLKDTGEALLPQAFELLGRKRRPQRDVGHQRQCVGQSRHRNVKPDGRRVETGRAAQIGAEEVDGIGEIERRARAGALLQHRRGQRGDPELARGIVGAAAQHDEIDLGDRYFVELDQPHRQPVRELLLLDHRQLHRRRRTRGRHLGAIGRLGGQTRGQGDEDGNRQMTFHGAHFSG